MIKHGLIAAAFGLAPVAASAATLDVAPVAPSVADAGEAFQLFGAGFTFTGEAYTLTADILTDGSIGTFGGGLVSEAGAAPVLGGELIDFGYSFEEDGADVLQFLFALDEESDPAFRDELLATVSGDFGDVAMFDAGFADPNATASLSATGAGDVAPIPLPAGGVLLLSALGAMALRRR